MTQQEIKQAISTIEYMLARNSYNAAQQQALEIALIAMKEKHLSLIVKDKETSSDVIRRIRESLNNSKWKI